MSSWIKEQISKLNYATKPDLKNGTGADTSDFAKATDLANLKSDVNKLDIDKSKNAPSNISNLKSKVDKLDTGKIETTPVDLSKLSNVVKNDVVKKTEYDELIKNVKNINTTDTSDLVKNNITKTSDLVKNNITKTKTITQKLLEVKRILLIMIMINILLLENLIS